MKAVSVIIPCYKLNKRYFEHLMNSVIAQTIGLDELEIILVNDASPDDTSEELQKYEAQYPEHIIVVNCEKNGGPGAARTIGLQYSSGKYVAFVDQDDWLDLAMYHILYDKAQEFDCDAVKCGWSRDDVYVCFDSSNENSKGRFWKICSREDRAEFLSQSDGGYWAAIYRRDMLLANNIYFPEQLAYDDNFFAGLVPFYYSRVYIIEQKLYHWFVNENSISMGNDFKKHCDRMKIELLLLDELKRRGLYEQYPQYIDYMFFLRFFLNTMHTIITRMGNLPYELMLEMRNILFQKTVDIDSNDWVMKKKDYLFHKSWIQNIILVVPGGCPEQFRNSFDRIHQLSFLEILHRDNLTEEEWQLTEFAYMKLQELTI